MPTDNLTRSPMVNALLTAAIIGLIGWTLLSVNELGKDVVALSVQIAATSKLTTHIFTDMERRVEHVEGVVFKDY